QVINKHKITSLEARHPNTSDILVRAFVPKSGRRKRDRHQVEIDYTNSGKLEKLGPRKKRRMELDRENCVIASGDIGTTNIDEIVPFNNSTQSGDVYETPSSDSEPNNNCPQGEEKLGTNEDNFEPPENFVKIIPEGARTITPPTSHDTSSFEEGSQVQTLQRSTQNVEVDVNNSNLSSYKEAAEQTFSKDNPYIDRVNTVVVNKTTKEDGNDSIAEDCLSQSEESNLEDLIEAEKKTYDNRLSEAINTQENQNDELMQEANSVEKSDSEPDWQPLRAAAR
ncbi:964_t:CDS:2, partial [Cetraspora pellucida]